MTSSDELRPCVQWEGCQNWLLNTGLVLLVHPCIRQQLHISCRPGSVPERQRSEAPRGPCPGEATNQASRPRGAVWEAKWTRRIMLLVGSDTCAKALWQGLVSADQ